MDQAEHLKAKRRLQNRISQRCFRNRQKGNAALASPAAIQGCLEAANLWHTTGAAESSSNLLAPDPALMTPELQTFCEEFESNLTHRMDASEEVLFEILSPISLPRSCAGDNALARGTDRDYGLNTTPIEQSGLNFTSPVPSQPGTAAHVASLADGSMFPDSTFSISDASHHTPYALEPVPVESLVEHSNLKLPRARSFTHQPKEAQTDIEKSNTSSNKPSRIKKTATCCVAHKAEAMVSEVEELCQFGARFGLLEKDDTGDVEECLRYLKTKLREVARCADGSVLC